MWPDRILKPPNSQRAAPWRCQVLADGGSPEVPRAVPKGGWWKCRASPTRTRAGSSRKGHQHPEGLSTAPGR